MIAMFGSVVMVTALGQGQVTLSGLAAVAAIAGFFTNSVIVGLYAYFAQVFPTHLRAGGIGFVIGMGRAGAMLGPILAGVLLDQGFGLSIVSFLMALGSLVALFMLLLLKTQDEQKI